MSAEDGVYRVNSSVNDDEHILQRIREGDLEDITVDSEDDDTTSVKNNNVNNKDGAFMVTDGGTSSSVSTSSNSEQMSRSSSRRSGIVDPPILENTDTLSGVNSLHTHDAYEELRRHSTGSFLKSKKNRDSDSVRSSVPATHTPYVSQRPLRSSRGKYTFEHLNNIQNPEALLCRRFSMRRNALCDPFRLPMPQRTRERLERDVEQRKTSVTRKVSKFFTVSLDLNREEELI